MKFDRTYKLSIIPNLGSPPISLNGVDAETLSQFNDKNQAFVISHPIQQQNTSSPGLTIRFNINRGFQINNQAEIEIFNLNAISRQYLYQDKFNIPFAQIDKETKKVQYRLVELSAGYLGLDKKKSIFNNIFIGNIIEGVSGVRKNDDIITKLICQENGYNNNGLGGVLSKSYGNKAKLEDLLKDCLNKLGIEYSNLKIAGLENILKQPLKAQTFLDNPYSILKKYFKDNFYIDNGVAYLIGNDEAVEGDLLVINDEAGLLESPARKSTTLELKILFEPRLILGQFIKINSQITPEFNGIYKIISIKHQGTISPSLNDSLTTILELFIGKEILGGLKQV